jgi:hypothetical protein
MSIGGEEMEELQAALATAELLIQTQLDAIANSYGVEVDIDISKEHYYGNNPTSITRVSLTAKVRGER